MIAAAESAGAAIVTAAHHLEVDLGVAAELRAAQVFGLVLHDHLLEQVVLLVDVLLADGLGSALAAALVAGLWLGGLIRIGSLHI